MFRFRLTPPAQEAADFVVYVLAAGVLVAVFTGQPHVGGILGFAAATIKYFCRPGHGDTTPKGGSG